MFKKKLACAGVVKDQRQALTTGERVGILWELYLENNTGESVERLCRAAGITRSTFYKYNPNKGQAVGKGTEQNGRRREDGETGDQNL